MTDLNRNPGPPRREGVWAALFCLFLAVLLYFPSLRAPWSLIDDGRFLHGASEAFSQLNAGHPAAFLRDLCKVQENQLGPALRALVALQWLAFRHACWAWHGMKILFCAATLLAVWNLARLAGGGRATCAMAVGFAALFGVPSVYADFQSYYANFARLFTTDSYQILFSLWAAVFVARGVLEEGAHPRRALGAAAAMVLLAGLTKATALHGVVCLLAFLAWVRLSGERRAGRGRGLGVWAAVVAAASIPGLLLFRPWENRPVFGYENVELISSFPRLASQMGNYLFFLTDGLGVLWIVATVLFLIRVGWFVARRIRRRCEAPAALSARLLVFLLFASGLALQAKWPILLPRYMLTFAPYLCVLFAVEMADAIRACVERPARSFSWRGKALVPWLALCGGALTWAIVFFPYYFIVRSEPARQPWVAAAGFAYAGATLLSCVWLLLRRRPGAKSAWAGAIAASFLAGGLFWQAVVVSVNAGNCAVNCHAAERAYSRVLTEAREMAAALPPETRAALFANLSGEPLGNAQILIEDVYGIHSVAIQELPPNGDPAMGPNDRVFLILDDNFAPVLRFPPFAAGRPAQPLTPVGPSAGVLAIRPGETLLAPIPLARAVDVAAVSLGADLSRWDPALDLRVGVAGNGPQASIREFARFEGIHLPHGYSGPLLARVWPPVRLPETATALELTCEPASFAPAASSHRQIVLEAQALSAASGASGKAPAIGLIGDAAAAPARALLKRTERHVYSVLFASPFYLARGYAGHWFDRTRRFPDALRRIRYDYATEVYGAAAER
ncbi:MAG: hypothetical protein NTW86_11030 [Candidatus Sumerlaeota bacterium]|nr:hypothetical protein [Candidatus Sumerlaeota bacterium]